MPTTEKTQKIKIKKCKTYYLSHTKAQWHLRQFHFLSNVPKNVTKPQPTISYRQKTAQSNCPREPGLGLANASCRAAAPAAPRRTPPSCPCRRPVSPPRRAAVRLPARAAGRLVPPSSALRPLLPQKISENLRQMKFEIRYARSRSNCEIYPIPRGTMIFNSLESSISKIKKSTINKNKIT